MFGAAPWRSHAERAYLVHYRNVDDFLMREERGDHILAGDYLEAGLVRTWDLPTWRTEWREDVRARLDHLGYSRLEEKAWAPHKSIPRLDTEVRGAWKQFYESITDGEYRAEFVKQVELRRRELVPFHVRVELLYL